MLATTLLRKDLELLFLSKHLGHLFLKPETLDEQTFHDKDLHVDSRTKGSDFRFNDQTSG